MRKFRNNPVHITLCGDEYFSRRMCVLADFFLLNIAFFMMNYLKRSTFKMTPDYLRLLLLYYFIWVFVSFVTKKFRVESLSYTGVIILQTKSIVFMAYCVSFLIVFFGLRSYSRVHIFGTFLMLFILEIFLFSLLYLGRKSEPFVQQDKRDDAVLRRLKISILLSISDLFLLTLAFFALNFYKRGSFVLTPDYEKILLLIYGLWLTAIVITQKFNIQNFQNFYFALAASLKSIIFMAFTLSSIIFAFRLFYFSRLHIFGTLLVYSLLEIVLLYFYFILKFQGNLIEDIESIEEIRDFYEQRELLIEGEQQKLKIVESTFMKLLSERYLRSFVGVYEFVDQTIDLSNRDDSETTIINSSDFFKNQFLEEDSVRLLINLNKINDIRRVNQYFLDIYRCLKSGGYVIGCANTIETHKKQFFVKYPKYFAEVLYVLQFFFFRVFPKLPKLRKVYFALTKGKNRMISKAEVLGRLCFCGFNILSEKEIGGSLYFIAQKLKTPSLDKNPSYGPLIKLRRAGINGQMLEVYKFRTMYPYSEYLQEYIFEHQKLKEGGKIRKDFRITDWGRYMRRYWIDELPMLYNWIKGDLKFFGVRPLSKHYLSLYDKHLQDIRKMIKPGLIPPYYAVLPKKIEEINESEKQYILAYLKHPFKTQCNYFLKVLNNIVLRGARSG